MRRGRASSRSATSRATKRTGSSRPRIESGASTAASAPQRDGEVEILEGLPRGGRRDPRPGLDRPRPSRPSAAFALATSSVQTCDHALAHGVADRSHSPVVPAAKTTSAP